MKNSTTPPFEIPTDMHKMTEQSLAQVRTATDAYIQFLQRAIPEDIMGGSELSHKVLDFADKDARDVASALVNTQGNGLYAEVKQTFLSDGRHGERRGAGPRRCHVLRPWHYD